MFRSQANLQTWFTFGTSSMASRTSAAEEFKPSSVVKHVRDFNCIVDTDTDILHRAGKRKRDRKKKTILGRRFETFTSSELRALNNKACRELQYTIDGEERKLCLHDVIILRNADLGPVTKVFSNGNFCLAKKKVLYSLKDIHINLSIVSESEQSLLDRNRFWYSGTHLEVYSRSRQCWYPGTIDKLFYLKPKDDVAHPEKWYAVSYHVDGKKQHKQLPWHSDQVRFSEPKCSVSDSGSTHIQTMSISKTLSLEEISECDTRSRIGSVSAVSAVSLRNIVVEWTNQLICIALFQDRFKHYN